MYVCYASVSHSFFLNLRLFHCQFCISTCAITAATYIDYTKTPTPIEMVATRVSVYTIHTLHRVQFLQLANGEWCHWCWYCFVLCCWWSTRLWWMHAMQCNFICYSWACLWAFDCLCNLNHLLFVERMPNEWNRCKNTNWQIT